MTGRPPAVSIAGVAEFVAEEVSDLICVMPRANNLRRHLRQQDERLCAMQDKIRETGQSHKQLKIDHALMQGQVALIWKQLGRLDKVSSAQKTTEAALTLSDAFDHFDRDRSGAIEVDELKPALAFLGLSADSEAVSRILRRYDTTGSSSIDVKEFAALLKDVQMLHSFDKNGDGTLEGAELMPALRHMGLNPSSSNVTAILRHWDADASGSIDLVEFGPLVRSLQLFSRFDKDGSGDIDATELRPMLRKLGLSVSTPQAEAILRRYDADNSGKIELSEFAVLVHELQLFATFDKNGDGTLEASELGPALRALGHGNQAPKVAAILAAWDRDGNGRIDLVEFSHLLRDLKVFSALDTDGDGSLDAEELRAGFKLVGVDVAKAAPSLKKYAARGSGRIELAEFASLVRELPALSTIVSKG